MRQQFGMASGLAVAAMIASCSGDPSLLLDGRGGDPRRSQSANEPDPGSAAAEAGVRPNTATHDSGAPVDAAKDAPHGDGALADGAAAATAFTGAGAFVATTGASARQATHAFAGNTPPTSPAKQACLGCHVAGGAAKPFAFGGTVFKDAAGTIPNAGVEIRVRASDGTALSAYTDEDGNFYQLATIAFPANVGARSAVATRVMLAAPPDGNCSTSQCHDGTAHPWINLP